MIERMMYETIDRSFYKVDGFDRLRLIEVTYGKRLSGITEKDKKQ